VSNIPIGALIAAASNVGRKSSTSTSFGSTKASSAATVMPARRAGNTSQPPGHGVTPAMFLKGDFFATTGIEAQFPLVAGTGGGAIGWPA
jgi:hypothetical protein